MYQKMSLEGEMQQVPQIWHDVAPVVFNIPGGREFLEKITHHLATAPFGQTLIAVGGPPGAGKETFIGQMMATMLDMQANPDAYPTKLPPNLEIAHLSYAEVLREARRRGMISSSPDKTTPEEREYISNFINELIGKFYENNNDGHPQLLFYEAVMVTYPLEDIGAVPLIQQQQHVQKLREQIERAELDILPRRRIFAAMLAPDRQLLEEVSQTTRRQLRSAKTPEDVNRIFAEAGTKFEGDLPDRRAIEELNTSWAGPNKFAAILEIIKNNILFQRQLFDLVLPRNSIGARPFLREMKKRKKITLAQLDTLFEKNPENFIFAQLASYFIFALANLELPFDDILVGANRRLTTDPQHQNPFHRRVVKEHALNMALVAP